MEIRIPRTATRRQSGDYCKILSRVKRGAVNGFGFEGALVRPGARIEEADLFANHRSAILLEHAGLDRSSEPERRPDGYGRAAWPNLYILWRHDRQVWRELARATSFDWSWTLDLGPIARRALADERPPVVPEAVAERIAKVLDGELDAVEGQALAFVLHWVHNHLATRIVYGETIMSVHKKDPAAVSLGSRGGKKGGAARAESLSPGRRQEIAKKAGIASGKARKKKGRQSRRTSDHG
jgi:hypothetical protein